MSSETREDPNTFVIFGGTGDLSRRKLLPALARIMAADQFGTDSQVLGVARNTEHDDASFRELVRKSIEGTELTDEQKEAFIGRCHYQTIGRSTVRDFVSLRKRLEELEKKIGLPQNRTFYLSLPPRAFPPTIDGFRASKLNNSNGWTRVVLEKPFGKDLASARELNQLVHQVFDEKQIYRIDHYLGKDTVQNLLVLRFANAIFESAWHRDRVSAVQIVVAESLGVGTRAGYYDQGGALRDMVQNHLTQLLTLVAMEVPSAYNADAIRYEKIKVLRSLAPIDIENNVVFGQYAAGDIDGEAVSAYADEDGVAEGSKTETFVAMKMFVNSWRWQGVPFYLRTGKCLPHRSTRIAIKFRDVPVSLFESMGGDGLDTSDVLMITLQPDEGFSLHFDVKRPGSPLSLQRIPLKFKYDGLLGAIPEAYQTLLGDIINGDQTLFVHADEVEESWRVYTPLIENPPDPKPYTAGSWGPPEADDFAIADKDIWQKQSD